MPRIYNPQYYNTDFIQKVNYSQSRLNELLNQQCQEITYLKEQLKPQLLSDVADMQIHNLLTNNFVTLEKVSTDTLCTLRDIIISELNKRADIKEI